MSDDTESDPLTIAEVFEAAAEQAETEIEKFEGEVPEHAADLIVRKAADLQTAISQNELARANEDVDPDEGQLEASVVDAAAQVIFAVGTYAFEQDLADDVEMALEERIEIMEAAREAETEEEFLEAVFGDDMPDEFTQEIEVGTNVDDEDYDPEGVDRTFQ